MVAHAGQQTALMIAVLSANRMCSGVLVEVAPRYIIMMHWLVVPSASPSVQVYSSAANLQQHPGMALLDPLRVSISTSIG